MEKNDHFAWWQGQVPNGNAGCEAALNLKTRLIIGLQAIDAKMI